MRIGGLDPFSLIDYPGKMAAVVFTQGCNFRCPYCYNPELVDPQRYGPLLDEQAVLSFLHQRCHELEAVVLGGGEPTLQEDLADFLRTVRGMGYATKLDTNGSRPDVLAGLLQEGLLDCVAMDVKAPLSRYAGYVQVPMDTQAISLSLDIVKGSGLDHELRTTVVKGDLDQADFQAMAQLVSGAKRYVLQRFQPGSALVDPTYDDRKAPDPAELRALAPLFHGCVTHFEVR